MKDANQNSYEEIIVKELEKFTLPQEDNHEKELKGIISFVNKTSHYFPPKYSEAIAGDIIENNNNLYKKGYSKKYLWRITICHILYFIYAAILIKLHEVVKLEGRKQIEK